jgi:hypothetical protein
MRIVGVALRGRSETNVVQLGADAVVALPH